MVIFVLILVWCLVSLRKVAISCHPIVLPSCTLKALYDSLHSKLCKERKKAIRMVMSSQYCAHIKSLFFSNLKNLAILANFKSVYLCLDVLTDFYPATLMHILNLGLIFIRITHVFSEHLRTSYFTTTDVSRRLFIDTEVSMWGSLNRKFKDASVL